MQGHSLPSFDPGFAGISDWAVMYRACGLQVVPAKPVSDPNPKRPDLTNWLEFQGATVSDTVFSRWYSANGSHSHQPNMGLIAGPASGNLVVIDLDTYKHPTAADWWLGLLVVHNNGSEPETINQVTGGGGRQLYFRARADWHPPTNRTDIGVDIRGTGGFAMLPPSQHQSGNCYKWVDGSAPWECEIAEAPEWLLEAIDTLVGPHGRESKSAAPKERTAALQGDLDPFGARVDGRDVYMRDMIWAAVVDWYGECPIPPDRASCVAKEQEIWETYERKCKTRLTGCTNADGLEREGRGRSLLRDKLERAVGKWDGDISRAWNERPKALEPAAPPLDADGKPFPLVLTAAQFMAGFTPPEYLWDGILQRGYLYALTARTGHGKTAVGMQFGLHVAGGVPFHGQTVKQGTVLLLAGENPDDVRARFIVACNANNIDPAGVKMRFIAGVVDIAASMPIIRAEAETIADLVLVIVDTAAAYFKGDDSNSNSQQGDYARLLRQMSFLPGKPAVLVNCHPIKNAAKDNLLPMGGSAFLNEIDGNLTLWSGAEKQTTLHWQGKFRGPEFEPMTFEIVTVTCEMVKDTQGRLMPSVIARPVTAMQVELAESKDDREVRDVLNYVARNPKISLQRIADGCNFKSKRRAQKIGDDLAREKLCEKVLGKLTITKKGKNYIGWDD